MPGGCRPLRCGRVLQRERGRPPRRCPAAGPCDVAESCDGIADACPADAKQPATFSCRAAAGPCDVAETCDGIGDACPVDAKQPATLSCRAAAGPCDQAERCDGSTDACPPDLFASGTPCAGPS